MSVDPTHFAIVLPISDAQAEEARALLETYENWVEAKVHGTAFDQNVSADDLAFFERIYDEEFEDWFGIEITSKRGQFKLEDVEGAPNVQLAGSFVSAILDRFDIDATVDLYWGGGSHSGHAVIGSTQIVWPDETEITRETAPTP